MAGTVIGKIQANNGMHTITSTFYGTCATAQGTKAKVVIINDPAFSGLDDSFIHSGTLLTVKFSAANTASGPTLALYTNSGTAASPTAGTAVLAAKAIKQYGTTNTGTSAAASWRAGAMVAFVYDGTYWVEVSSLDANTTYTNISLGNCIATSSTAAATAAKTATPINGTYTLAVNGIVSVQFAVENTEDEITLNIDGKGAKPVRYKGLTTGLSKVWDDDTTVTFYYDGTDYNIIAIDRPKGFNLGGNYQQYGHRKRNYIDESDYSLIFPDSVYFISE